MPPTNKNALAIKSLTLDNRKPRGSNHALQIKTITSFTVLLQKYNNSGKLNALEVT